MGGEISDPLLAFVACSRKTSTARNIKTVITVKFTPHQIKNAIEKMWDHCDTGVIGDFQERKDGRTRTATEAYVDDLLNAFAKLDDGGSLPTIVVNADELHLVPRIHPEEIDLVSMAERLTDVEQALQSMRNILHSRGPSSKGMDPARSQARPTESIWQMDEQATHPKSTAQEKVLRSASRPGRSGGVEVESSSSVDPLPQQRSMADVAADLSRDDFIMAKKKKRMPRKKGTEGTAKAKQDFKGGSDTFMVQITNVNPSVGVEHLNFAKYIAVQGVEEKETTIKDTSTEGWPTKGYLITFPHKLYDKVLSLEFWPARVYYSQYFLARGNGGKSAQRHG